jgi:hypothetical protein
MSTEFANFLSSAAGGGGSGAGFTGPATQNVILPPVNISQAGGGGYGPPLPANTFNNPYLNVNAPHAAVSSSSSSSSAPLNPYDRYRNYTFIPNFDTNNYGAAYDPSKRASKIYDTSKISRDQYGQNYDVSELNLGGFKDRLKKSKKAGMRRLV